jgi:hypothetical protein
MTCQPGQRRSLGASAYGKRKHESGEPLKNMLIPTSVPITYAALEGHVRQIVAARMRVTIQSPRRRRDREPIFVIRASYGRGMRRSTGLGVERRHGKIGKPSQQPRRFP